MNRISIVFFLFTLILHAQEQEHIYSEYFKFVPGDTEIMFADNVKLRSEPGLESEVLELIPIGAAIKILKVSDASLNFDGIVSPWYKVDYKGKVGFVLGGLVSFGHLKFGSALLLFQLKKNGGRNPVLKVREIIEGEPYISYEFELIGDQYSIQFLSNKGLKGVDKIVAVNYEADACMVEGGVTYLSWSVKGLQKMADLSELSDAGIFYFSESFEFMEDNPNIKEGVLYTQKLITVENDEELWERTSITTRFFKWDGQQFVGFENFRKHISED
ncbi:SH3 domain-containing protein [Robertkochia solimangrovi]|uniref:SH3 domain-containing protein n=1 Tax=Robertkochia solimangrovi TaxID=2213046 RepID=UPI00117F4D03|nr:SH3 domain-containing protein [Robertkochia solimangrovi]TRZ43190.1 hypothetical protein DMZ48_10885 [Robertkochia solimangrovi]